MALIFGSVEGSGRTPRACQCGASEDGFRESEEQQNSWASALLLMSVHRLVGGSDSFARDVPDGDEEPQPKG